MRAKILLGAAGAPALGILVAMSCGGRIGYPGTLDDRGVYRLDGALVFGPASFCESEAGAIYAKRPLCNELEPDANEINVQYRKCSEWLRTFFPYDVEGNCLYADGGPEHCVAGNIFSLPIMECVPGPDGDAYCRAFFQQFVIHGKAVAKCQPGNPANSPSIATCAAQGCHCAGLTANNLCVERDGVTACQDLCAP